MLLQSINIIKPTVTSRLQRNDSKTSKPTIYQSVFQKTENSTPINPYAKEYWESDEKYKSLTEEQYNNNFALINKNLAEKGKLKRSSEIKDDEGNLIHSSMIKDKRRLPHEYQPLLPDDETARLIEHAKNVGLDDATLERIHLEQRLIYNECRSIIRNRTDMNEYINHTL